MTSVFMTYAATLSVLRDEWGMSATAAGSISTGFQLGYAVSLVFFSSLADRVGARRVLLGSAWLSAVFALAWALWARSYLSGLVLSTRLSRSRRAGPTPRPSCSSPTATRPSAAAPPSGGSSPARPRATPSRCSCRARTPDRSLRPGGGERRVLAPLRLAHRPAHRGRLRGGRRVRLHGPRRLAGALDGAHRGGRCRAPGRGPRAALLPRLRRRRGRADRVRPDPRPDERARPVPHDVGLGVREPRSRRSRRRVLRPGAGARSRPSAPRPDDCGGIS